MKSLFGRNLFAILVLAATLTCAGGCGILDLIFGGADDTEETTSTDLAGYWMSNRVVNEASSYENEEETQAKVDVGFYQFVKVGGDSTLVVYEVYLACKPDEVVGYATAYEEGTVIINTIEGDMTLTAILADTDTLLATQEVDGGTWLAQRVEEPTCSGGDDSIVTFDQRELLDAEAEVTETEDDASGAGAPNGVAHLDAAKGSRLTIGEEYSKPSTDATTTCSNNGSTVACPASTTGHAGYVECVDRGMDEAKVQQLSDVACLLDTDQVYPGSLLQGAHYDGGSFAPVTIARAGGTITLSGLAFGGSATYDATVNTVSYANITNAIAGILSGNSIEGTVANATYRVDAVQSSNQWAFNLGTDVKFMSADLKASSETNNESSQNTVIMKFTQVFYTVSFEDPVLRTDVFADKAAFDDPENQIGTGNPPLYVSNVKYGRQVFFVAKSSLGSNYVKAALSGAYSGAADVTVTSGMSYKNIMSQTSITYIVRGGDAGLALAPINSASPDQMYDKIKEFLANRNAATFSSSNPGIPVAYTLRYLDDRTVAMKGLTTSYDKHDCRTIPAEDYQFSMKLSQIDDDVHVYLDSETAAMQKGYTNTITFEGDITSWLPDDNDHIIIIKVGNYGGYNTSCVSVFYRDGAEVWRDDYLPYGWRWTGYCADIRVRVNRASGKFEVVNVWHL